MRSINYNRKKSRDLRNVGRLGVAMDDDDSISCPSDSDSDYSLSSDEDDDANNGVTVSKSANRLSKKDRYKCFSVFQVVDGKTVGKCVPSYLSY